MSNKWLRITLPIFILLMLGILIFQTRKTNTIRYSQSKMMMDTLVKIDVCTVNPGKRVRSNLETIWSELEKETRKFNLYEAESELSFINRKAGIEPVKVSSSMFKLIHKSVEWSQKTEGAFDITVKPLMDFWKEQAKKNAFPDSSEIQSVLSLVGNKKINFLNNEYLQFRQPGIALDLGGIVPGYLADFTADQLKKKGYKNFLVDMGGEIYASGTNCTGKPWHTAIRNPNYESQQEVILLKNHAVSTSGNYERFWEIAGKKYSHIINPKTGLPSENAISVTVIAPTATEADVLSTALSVLDVDKGKKFINLLGNEFAAMWIINTKGTIENIKTDSFKNYQM